MDKFVRFKDLKAAGLVDSWNALKKKQEKEDFPLGRLIGRNMRAWTETEIETWLAARPVGKKPVPRGRRKRKAADEEGADASATTS